MVTKVPLLRPAIAMTIGILIASRLPLDWKVGFPLAVMFGCAVLVWKAHRTLLALAFSLFLGASLLSFRYDSRDATDLRQIIGGEPDGRIGLMDLTVQRNAFGRQIDSFETDLAFKGLEHPIHAVFIRAPLVDRLGPHTEALATLPDGRVVAARQGHLLATAFHPELTPDTSLHALFIASCKQLAVRT